jgi:hypothetical protein
MKVLTNAVIVGTSVLLYPNFSGSCFASNPDQASKLRRGP